MAPVEFEIWLNHFEHHGRHPRSLPAGLPSRLLPKDAAYIASSIATFQRGEQSEGTTLLKAAQRCARARGTPALARIIELLIREEQRHAALLREYMENNHIAPSRGAWTDRIFRRIRRLAGLEFYLEILISAELIGIVYYRALERATTCPRFILLCRILVSDELAHVGFESQLLLWLRARRTPLARTLIRWAHRGFFALTASVVWWTHRALLRRTGYSASSFLHACLSQYAFYLEPVDTGAVSAAGGDVHA